MCLCICDFGLDVYTVMYYVAALISKFFSYFITLSAVTQSVIVILYDKFVIASQVKGVHGDHVELLPTVQSHALQYFEDVI